MTQLPILTPSPSTTVPEPYSKSDLLEILIHWHQASSSEIPEAFPGPHAGKAKLAAWVHDVRKGAEERRIPRQQWANALLAWLPAAPEGKSGFKERLLTCMRGKREAGHWEKGRF
ncbi:hypothetical protein NP233_g12063 [Leucocoprinus birnbaumii]|uniref:Uncharacterized protein n=1 Tax=Leucocoprinus birnbaumii TaxID=56174 RepID=A0AAD5VF33_9AGAR|nr:hypothetical protein NP233_g12063 [Leucocoprinus birnbaumii]